jgi:hypothetical protein
MEKRWCSACGQVFEPRPQSPRQAYCANDVCQRARKRLWQRAKRSTDDDYRENQLVAQTLWRRNHPDYWRQYREAHPDYTASNRHQQQGRNARRLDGASLIANEDASTLRLPPTGVFRLTQVQPTYRGARREWTVELTVLPEAGRR